jgi:hypothetical protein
LIQRPPLSVKVTFTADSKSVELSDVIRVAGHP